MEASPTRHSRSLPLHSRSPSGKFTVRRAVGEESTGGDDKSTGGGDKSTGGDDKSMGKNEASPSTNEDEE